MTFSKFSKIFINKNNLKFYSSIKNVKVVKYTDTINLPKTKFPTRLSAAIRNEVEKSIIEKKLALLYNYQQEHKSKPNFVLHDGPPYANGDLHMGHAVNKILKDITIKQNISNDKSVHYIAGWDCHGLPIELKALKGDSKFTVFYSARKFALQTIEKQKSEFKSWGVTADWNNPNNLYKTLNPQFIENQLKVFLKFYEKNLVFRDMKPVFWSPSSRTALAEAELEYDSNFESPSIILSLKVNELPKDLKVKLSKNLFALIWTTTPWTLPSNQAICFNPNLKYSICSFSDGEDKLYLIATNLIEQFKIMTSLNLEIKDEILGSALNGCTYFHPVEVNCELPFLPGEHVTDFKGTGLVHTAPAHGHDDFLIGLQNQIKIKNFIDDSGKYTDEAPKFLIGKHVLDEGDKLVIDYLHENILFSGKIIHSYPIDWRTKKPVIIKSSEQWFMNTEKLKEKAIKEIEKVHFYPKINAEQYRRALTTQVMKRPYWCISRQRVWGVPIPVFYNKNSGEIIINEKIIGKICDTIAKDKNIDFWWTKDTKDILSEQLLKELNLNADDLEKSHDIFDIWFDSGITWFSALEGNKIADMYLEGYDQFTGWFQSSLLTSVGLREYAPYKSIFVHGFTVDEKGHKMSKSLGNIISPKNIITKYGTDTLRWWVASHGTQNTSITVSETLLKSSAENVAKIRSILRYLNGALGDNSKFSLDNIKLDVNSKLCYLDKFMLNELHKFGNEVTSYYNAYEYNRVIATLQYFITNQLSAIYLHIIKDRLYCGTNDDRNQIKYVLKQCYEVLCKMLWPIIPFTIEESWSYYDKTSFFENNIIMREEWKSNEIENLINFIFELKKNIYKHVKDVNTWTLQCELFCNAEEIKLIQCLHPVLCEPDNSSELCEILQLSSINLNLSKSGNLEFTLKQIDSTLCPRCRRFPLENHNTLCNRCMILINK
ncbi:isoleucine--tRNA ligase, mitochondrial isoform X2 [Condylostylus longicornis]|uniref:isoleucine--tRNA ligase, mitochondrial isoform X2 n=1 Tax=Condylostylus longicornis TaxID=2530218 RepID=UPI00244DBA79|nr:isoleucine--tRNA ligase, mitochondrial isoform X2 [Condylostylus longicornis]